MSPSTCENQSNRDYNNWRRGPQEINVTAEMPPLTNQDRSGSQFHLPSASVGGGTYIGRGRKVEEGSKGASSQTRNFSNNRTPRTLGTLGNLGAGSFGHFSVFNPLHPHQTPVQATASNPFLRGRLHLPAKVDSELNVTESSSQPSQVNATYRRPRGVMARLPSTQSQLSTSSNQPMYHGVPTRLPSTYSQLSTSSNEPALHRTPSSILRTPGSILQNPERRVSISPMIEYTPRVAYTPRPAVNCGAEPESGPAKWEPAPNAERPRRLFNQGTPLQQCIKKVTALLNKLSIKNFDSITNQVLEKLETSEEDDHEEIAKSIFGVIFKKSLDEHAYAEIYAQLVRSILDKVAPPPERAMYKTKAENRQALFRTYLLGQCQEFFEAIWPNEVQVKSEGKGEAESGLKSVDSSKSESEKISQVVDFSDAYYAEQKLKRHRIGLVGFIGELFTLRILAPQIVGRCLTQLLHKPEVSEADIESACAMVAKVGPGFDSRNPVPALFEATLRRLKQVQDAQAPNSRMKFLIMNLLESRATGWKKATVADEK